MIQSNELRTGNWVYNSTTRQNMEVYPMMIPQLYRLEKDGGNTVNIQPIPLTEEILLRCGFRCTEESGTSKGFSIGENIVTRDYLVYLTWLKRIDGKGLDPYPFYRNGRHIVKYLHQLQNLYYALTGEELEVSL